MKFESLVKKTLYKPATLARAVLYGIGSDRLLAHIASVGYEIEPSERKQIIQIVAGNKDVKARFESKTPVKPKSESPQIDLIETQSKAEDSVA